MMEEPLRVFVSYSYQDRRLRDKLFVALKVLERQGIIRLWDDREIRVGVEWRTEIDARINSSSLILVLISANFLASDYLYGKEMQRALALHESRKAQIIPIILRPCLWQETALDKLQVLPRSRTPVSLSLDEDKTFMEIAQEILLVSKDFQFNQNDSERGATPLLLQDVPTVTYNSSSDNAGEDIHESVEKDTLNMQNENVSPHYLLEEVFSHSNVPGVTFVKRHDFNRLKLALRASNRGVVLEGPSGIGKTTALRKAVEALKMHIEDEPFLDMHGDTLKDSQAGTLFLFRATNARHVKKLMTLRQWHNDPIIIDDFHHLLLEQRTEIVGYLKELADTSSNKKLVLVGIPNTGQSLIDTVFDLAMRIEVFRLGLVKDELILQMIELGEKALNIVFDRKSEVVLASKGSLNIAQYLCYNICANADITETQQRSSMVQCNTREEVQRVIAVLEDKFGAAIRSLAAMGGNRDTTALKLLEALSKSEKGVLYLSMQKEADPTLVHGINLFINNRWMEHLYDDYPASKKYLFYEPSTHALIVDDPQFSFYLGELIFSSLERQLSKFAPRVSGKVFVSYSHADSQRWLNLLITHLTPLVRMEDIKLWTDKNIVSGTRWHEEIQKNLEEATICIMLVSANFRASEFINDTELPRILERANKGGTEIISLIVDPCDVEGSGLDIFQIINRDKPLSGMGTFARGTVMQKLAEDIKKILYKAGRE